MRFLKGFGRFWYDFLVGDDWKIAATVVAVVAVATVLVAAGINGALVAPIFGAVVIVGFVISMFIDVSS